MKARIYTKTGDKGQTSLVGGMRVAKTHPRLEAYGTLDELNSWLGLIRAELPQLLAAPNKTQIPEFVAALEVALEDIQNSLFNIGSHLACEDDTLRTRLPDLHETRLKSLESNMDIWEGGLPPLKNFILPGGSPVSAHTHLARTVCRRAERLCVALAQVETVNPNHLVYLNRLSDWLFVVARQINFHLGIADIEWKKDPTTTAG